MNWTCRPTSSSTLSIIVPVCSYIIMGVHKVVSSSYSAIVGTAQMSKFKTKHLVKVSSTLTFLRMINPTSLGFESVGGGDQVEASAAIRLIFIWLKVSVDPFSLITSLLISICGSPDLLWQSRSAHTCHEMVFHTTLPENLKFERQIQEVMWWTLGHLKGGYPINSLRTSGFKT